MSVSFGWVGQSKNRITTGLLKQTEADRNSGPISILEAKMGEELQPECMCVRKRKVFLSIVAFKCHSASTYAVAAASHFSQLWWPCTCQVWNRSAKQTQKVFRLVHRKRTVKFAVARTQLELLQEKVSQQPVLNVNGVKPLSWTTTHRSNAVALIQKCCVKSPAPLTPLPFPSSVELFTGTFDLASKWRDAAFTSAVHRAVKRRNEGARAKVEDKRCVGGATRSEEWISSPRLKDEARENMQGGCLWKMASGSLLNCESCTTPLCVTVSAVASTPRAGNNQRCRCCAPRSENKRRCFVFLLRPTL